MAEYAEMEYFCQAAQGVASQIGKNQGLGSGKKLGKAAQPIAAASAVTEDFIGLNNAIEENKNPELDEDSVDEVDRLREENKRLKKTLLEKFQGEGDIWDQK